jgi:5'-nucleotidase
MMGNENHRPLILVTNDDGYKARGLLKLTSIAREFGDVVVVAATESQSGMSHAITIKHPLKFKLIEESEGYTKYMVRGTPVDGVKLAMCKILKRRPDLVLSGINHGSNASSSIIYSGTMAAVIEGAVNHVPSIGFSLLDYSADADFDASETFVRHIINQVIIHGLPPRICLNVNIPAVAGEALKGIRYCRQADGFWKEEFEERVDPRNTPYYWLTGYFENREPEADDTDEYALRHNMVSVVPVNTDLTAHHVLDELMKWEQLQPENEK